MTIELEFLVKQMERILNEIGSAREDMTVMIALMRRVEKNLDSLEAQLTDMRHDHEA